MPGPDLDPAVGPRQPGDHAEVLVEAALHRREPLRELPAPRQPGRGEQAGHLVEDAELLGDARRRTGRRRRARARAAAGRARRRAPAATVVRPGAPAGPQTATTRPAADAALGRRGGPRGRRLVGRRTPVGGRLGRRHRVGQRVEVVVGDERSDADPGGPQPAAVEGGAAGDDRDRPDAVPAQVVDGGAVEARARRGRRTATSAWPARGGGEQVVDVDAALEHDDARVRRRAAASAARLPGRAGGDDQDDDRSAIAQPRRTTVSDRARRASRAAAKNAARRPARRPPARAGALPVAPKPPSSGGASTTVDRRQHRPPGGPAAGLGRGVGAPTR